VDLLSQPFEERSSTISFNTHGCKYPSKHHLPKNSWVTIEVPGREGVDGRQRVRARVVWIQKPRSVRELFQIAVELESPGNIWSLEAPPGDWLNTLASAEAEEVEERRPAEAVGGWTRPEERPAPRNEPIPIERPKSGAEGPLSDIFEKHFDPAEAFPGKSAEPLGFAGQVVPEAAREGSLESPLLRELNAQMETQAARTVEAAAARASEALKRTAEAIQEKQVGSAEAAFRQWKESFERERAIAAQELARRAAEQISGARDEIAGHFTGQLSWVREELRSDLKQEFATHLDEMKTLVADLQRGAAALREEANAAASAGDRMAQINVALEAAEAAVDERIRRLNESAQESVALEDLSKAWRERLIEQMTQAKGEWNELLENSIDGAAHGLAARLAETTQAGIEGAGHKLDERVAQFTQPVAGMVQEAQAALGHIRTSLEEELQKARTSLGEIEQAAVRMKEFSGQIEAASGDAVKQLHQRLDGVVEKHAGELQKHANRVMTELPQRLQPALEAAGEQFVARTIDDLDAKLKPHIERVPNLIRELTAHEVQAEESLRIYRERLRQASESSRRDTAEEMKATLAELRNEFEGARSEALNRWTEELNASGARATHAAIENLIQTAEWHQKQAQAYVETLTQESLRRAENFFAERTQEASERLGGELQQRKTSFLADAHGELQADATDVVAVASRELERAAVLAAAAFEDRAGTSAAGGLRSLSESAEALLNEKSAQVERISEKIRENFEAAAAILVDRLRDQIAAHSEQKLHEARDMHARELATALEAGRIEREAEKAEWGERVARANDESLRRYEDQLQSASDVWINAAVQKLNQNGDAAVAALSRSGEQALRASFLRIFEQVTEGLRQSVAEGAGGDTKVAAAAAGSAASGSGCGGPATSSGSGSQDSHAGA
jgi:hypothetical protein